VQPSDSAVGQDIEADVTDANWLHDVVFDDGHVFLRTFSTQNSTTVPTA